MTQRALRRVAEIIVSNVDKHFKEGESQVRLCNYTDVYYRDRIRADQEFSTATATATQIERFRLRPGDSIITKDSETADDIAIPTFVESSAEDLVCGYHLAIIRPGGMLHPSYLAWALRSEQVKQQFTNAAQGMTRVGITYDGIKSVRVPVPPLEEQRRIADFLDDQVTRIDNIQSARQAQVTAMEERQLGLVDAGTSSGRRRRLGYSLSLLKDGTHGSFMRVDEGVPLLSVRNMQGGRLIRRPDDSHVSRADYEAISRGCPVMKGDVLLAIVGTLGKVARSMLDVEYCLQRSVAVLRPSHDTLDAEYLVWALRSRAVQDQLWLAAGYSAQPGVYLATVADLRIHVPDLRVQRRLAAELNQDQASLEAGLAAIERSSCLLEERKRALITAAVTGQIDVSTAAGVA